MEQTAQRIKESIMLIEQKLERYSLNDTMSCPVVITKLKSELDQLYIDLLQLIEDENNGLY